MGCALLGFSKQDVQGAWHVCTVGLSRDALGSVKQRPRVQDAERGAGICRAAMGTPLVAQNMEDIRDH